jgi:hypothetical protein
MRGETIAVWVTVLGAGLITVSAHTQTGARQVPNRSDMPATKPSLNAALTASECTQLGGQVGKDQYGICPTRQFCAARGPDGVRHLVCLTETKSKDKAAATGSTFPARRGVPGAPFFANEPMTGLPGRSRATPLNQAECVGLGGKVVPVVDSCPATQKACYRADVNGVIHNACLSSLE